MDATSQNDMYLSVMEEVERNDTYRLLVAQAMYKALGPVVSTKDPDSLRSRFDSYILDNYAQTGAKTIDLRGIDGAKCGTASVRVGKDTPAHVERHVRISSGDTFMDAVRSDPSTIDGYVASHMEEIAEWCLDHDGELLDGVSVETREVPMRPGEPQGVTLRIDPQKVWDSFGKALPSAVAGLLAVGEFEE